MLRFWNPIPGCISNRLLDVSDLRPPYPGPGRDSALSGLLILFPNPDSLSIVYHLLLLRTCTVGSCVRPTGSMNSRKRQAQEPLLPIGSVKHRRTRYNLEEDSGLATRWINFFKEGWALTGLTFAQITESKFYASLTVQLILTPYVLIGGTSTPEPLLPVLSSSHQTHCHLPPRTPSSSYTPTQPSSPSRPLQHSSRETRKPRLVPEPYHPSTISATASTSSIPSTSTSTYTTHPEVDRALTEAERRIRRTSPAKPYTRPHIYADSVRALYAFPCVILTSGSFSTRQKLRYRHKKIVKRWRKSFTT